MHATSLSETLVDAMLRACTVYREGLHEDKTRRSESWHSPAKERIFYIPDCLQSMDRIAAAEDLFSEIKSVRKAGFHISRNQPYWIILVEY